MPNTPLCAVSVVNRTILGWLKSELAAIFCSCAGSFSACSYMRILSTHVSIFAGEMLGAGLPGVRVHYTALFQRGKVPVPTPGSQRGHFSQPPSRCLQSIPTSCTVGSLSLPFIYFSSLFFFSFCILGIQVMKIFSPVYQFIFSVWFMASLATETL